jgi:hypothetical protein
MFSLAQLRRVGPLLLGLFMMAQAAGIMPLIGTHIQHALENDQDIAADLGESGKLNHVHHHHAHRDGGPHEHGTNDANDQCCTLHHHLAGVIPIASSAKQRGLTVPIAAVPLHPLVGADPSTLERPPKLPLSI